MSDANVQDDCKWQVVEAKWLGVLEIELIKDICQLIPTHPFITIIPNTKE